MNKKISGNIRKIRKMKGYTQEWMAAKLGVSQKAYSKLETGKTNLNEKYLQKVATIFDVGTAEIVHFSEDILSKKRLITREEAERRLAKISEVFYDLLMKKDEEIDYYRKKLKLEPHHGYKRKKKSNNFL